MIKELLYKWLGIEPLPCPTCEVLRLQLEKSEEERRQLLDRLLSKDEVKPEQVNTTELQPIQPRFLPWRAVQQKLEKVDREEAAKLLKKKQEEMQAADPVILGLEKELLGEDSDVK